MENLINTAKSHTVAHTQEHIRGSVDFSVLSKDTDT